MVETLHERYLIWGWSREGVKHTPVLLISYYLV